MSLGVEERSASMADASEMMEGWREWHGLTRTAATAGTEEDRRFRHDGLWDYYYDVWVYGLLCTLYTLAGSVRWWFSIRVLVPPLLCMF